MGNYEKILIFINKDPEIGGRDSKEHELSGRLMSKLFHLFKKLEKACSSAIKAL